MSTVIVNGAAIGAAFLLVLLNGFFVAAEFAIVKVRRTRLEELVGKGIAQARVSLLCVDQLDEYLSATQLGITIASLALGWLGEPAFRVLVLHLLPEGMPFSAHTVEWIATVLAFLTVTLLHVVLGELVPKTIAIQYAEKMTLWLSPGLRAFYIVTKPLIRFFTRMADTVLWLLQIKNTGEQPLTENELKLVMEDSKEDGVISDSEAQIITRAFEFADKRVSEIMVYKDKAQVISLANPLEQNLATVRTRMHTRFPLCDRDLNSVVGIVLMKDVWPQLLKQFSNEAFQKCARPPIYVDPSLRQDQLMKLFQSARAHMAIVQDSNTKENLGIVTLEDVLEHLVGEIRDEHGN